MNKEKSLKNSKIAITMFFVTIIVTIIGLAAFFIALVFLFPDATGSSSVKLSGPLFTVFIVSMAAIVIATILYLIFYILVIIDASKDKENTNFTLLVVGLFIPIVGTVALFMHRSNLKKEA